MNQNLQNLEAEIKASERYKNLLLKRNFLLERLLEKSWTPEQIKTARKEYEKNPKQVVRSDDSYSRWTDSLRWDELTVYDKIPYIYPEEKTE